ncbi:GDSL esterase/lipase At5g55050 [Setaria viridis]|uniref:GDSL esterase/lipase At5g55050 n=1 Tax=Setaria viridis TaxID=4556 RepID=UPI003B3B900C
MGAATVTSSHRSMAVAVVAFSAAATTFLLAAATAAAASPVPAIYVLGDSIADVGNNNHLPTFLRADFPHNGIDYPGRKATGRFSNGNNSVDFIGGSLLVLHLVYTGYYSTDSYFLSWVENSVPVVLVENAVLVPVGKDQRSKNPSETKFSRRKRSHLVTADNLGLASPPPYLALSRSNANYANGVNFASGGAGVSKATNKDVVVQGLCISFDKQIDYYSSVYASLAQSLGQAQAAAHLSKSLFVITIGSNDIIHYAKSSSAAGNLPPQPFVDALIQTLTAQLQRLYDLGARKLVFLGTAPVGCCPRLRKLSAARDCSAVANDASVRYNAAAASLLGGMAARHPDMHYALFDSSAALLPFINTPTAYGFAEARVACCGLGDMNAKIGCTPLSSYCANRMTHVFWDLYHPTEATAQKLTSMAFDGSVPLIFPMNIRQLSAL